MNKVFLPSDLLSMDRIFRLNFFNAINGFKNAALIGTADTDGATNLAIFNSVIHIGSNPPLLGFILRPTSVDRHTYENLIATGHYTINHLPASHFKAGHQTSAKYPREVSEFEACGFTPQYTQNVKAPYVEESHIKIGLAFEEEKHIQANQTILVIGRVLEIIVPENIIETTGHLNIDQADAVAVVGLDSYYKASLLGRMPYAKP